ncbi:AT-hook motif nuclear-localized protein 1 [Hibiscus syriacus]|uniref:AT-hook motif nuclear-localized protein n=1 Tax=Hibiscus syriacus TaxID=106335 RepID=A0A6A2ZTX9_HIBSY|nr:AT-hook motif nuclear-localized protein 1-like [Hibiscus syriacus]XP_039011342.1 AT-hook motif nuclear-localized protein 1-like [Hibiscus syriacus]KAE8694315.1 AT-hook motif nuclear-localized protein 1 [Hibiscus syriacus]
MEPKEFETSAAATAGVTVVRSDAPSAYHIAPRTEKSTQTPNPTPGSAPPQQQAAQPGVPRPVSVAGLPEKKKRGRPRKYGPDGSITKALSPKPISTAAPPSSVIDFSAGKRGKVKSPTSFSKPRNELENLGEWVACSVGANFTPHIITVNAGEDVTMKIMSFSQQGPRAICILSANGVISSVTLRQPDSSGGTLTYEGRFEILSLSGSFMPNESGATRSRSGGMSVSLASPDGRVVGGGVAGLLVAAGPVQVVVGSFLAGNQHKQNLKKQKPQSMTISAATPMSIIPISSADPKLNISSSFRTDTWSPTDSRNKPTDINASVHGA